MAKRPSISVVIPTFRRPALLERAIASVLAQNLPPDEIIVVDDASPEPPAAAMGRFADPRIVLIRRRINGGGSAATDDGVHHARGTLVALLDDDDEWHPERLARQLQLRARLGDPDGTVIGTFVIADRGGWRRCLPHRAPRPGEAMADYLFVRGGIFHQSSLLMPTALARRIRFDHRTRRHQDLGFVLRAEAAGGRFAMVEQPLVRWSADAGDARVGASRDPAPSFAWAALMGAHLTPRQRAGFLARHAADAIAAGSQIKALGVIGQAVWLGALGKREALSIAARIGLPKAFGQPLHRLAAALAPTAGR